ncbi:hypothetical protein REA19_19950 [Prescottella equi]|nr:hypothetical protein REA19_19950 [Prescottella equi]
MEIIDGVPGAAPVVSGCVITRNPIGTHYVPAGLAPVDLERSSLRAVELSTCAGRVRANNVATTGGFAGGRTLGCVETIDQNAGRSYEVRTYGCQMNVHDSERLSGL